MSAGLICCEVEHLHQELNGSQSFSWSGQWHQTPSFNLGLSHCTDDIHNDGLFEDRFIAKWIYGCKVKEKINFTGFVFLHFVGWGFSCLSPPPPTTTTLAPTGPVSFHCPPKSWLFIGHDTYTGAGHLDIGTSLSSLPCGLEDSTGRMMTKLAGGQQIAASKYPWWD